MIILKYCNHKILDPLPLKAVAFLMDDPLGELKRFSDSIDIKAK